MLERAAREPIRAIVAAPPQHGKTLLTCHAFPYWLKRQPKKRHGYVTYAAERARDVAIHVQQLAAEAGLQLLGSRRRLRTPEGGSINFTGVGGPLTGYGIDGVLVLDDVTKNRAEAESLVYRERNYQWLKDVGLTRLHKDASCLVMATRWHPDDVSGRLEKEGWLYINLAALAEDEDDPLGREFGDPLAPALFPRETLELRREEVGPFTWSSLYQGRPRPRGGAVFNEPRFYSRLPAGTFRVGRGVDLAYTKKTSADWSVYIEILRFGDDYYVTEVIRKQVDAPAFTLTLRAKATERPSVRMRWHASGTEAGSASFIKRAGVPLEVLQAKGDPFVRSIDLAAAWNAGHVFILEDAPWLAPFLDELLNFTGVNDANDDQVVAAASAHSSLQTPRDAYSQLRARRGLLPKPRS